LVLQLLGRSTSNRYEIMSANGFCTTVQN
jgi:hypothetical protein